MILHEGDRLPEKLYAVVSGAIQVTKTVTTGKETILRGLTAGEIFAAPALLGNGISPANVTAECNCEIVTVQGKDIALYPKLEANSKTVSPG